MSPSDSQCNLFLDYPAFLSPSGFQVRDCHVIQFDDFSNICLIHFQCLFSTSSSGGSWS
ncbi:unnamed protein product, partial [Schistosoma rodhaini]